MQKRIAKIELVRSPDYDGQFDYYGSFGNEPTSEFSIPHESDNRRTLNWFNPCTDACESAAQASEMYARILAFERGEWHWQSIKAQATIETSYNGLDWLTNRIKSGGVYGIESDMPESEKHDIETEQLDELVDTLKALGFTTEEIEQAESISNV